MKAGISTLLFLLLLNNNNIQVCYQGHIFCFRPCWLTKVMSGLQNMEKQKQLPTELK